MKVFKILSALSFAFLAMTFTSCLGGNDDYNGQATGQDFVTVASYSPQNITFSLTNQNGGIISLYSNQAAKVDETQYPVGSRAFITYSYQVGQDVSKAVKIDLMSINPVTTIPLYSVTQVPGISYGRISTSRIYYLANYVNMILSVQKSNNRTWNCYFDSASSNGDVAELYLDTKATDETPDLIGVALSVDVSSITSGNRFKTIRFHINDQNGTDHTYDLALTTNTPV